MLSAVLREPRRYPIILFERLLRQLVVVALRGRGARFRDWVVSSTAANPPAFVAAKMLLWVQSWFSTCWALWHCWRVWLGCARLCVFA